MNSPLATLKAFTEAAADAVARAIANIQREAVRERELRDAEHRARLAEFDLRIATSFELERRLTARLESVKDGEPGRSLTLEDVAPVVEEAVREAVREAVSAIPAPKDGEPGKSVDPAEVDRLVSSSVAAAVAELPQPVSGKDADPAVIAEMVRDAVAALPAPKPGKDADPELVERLVDEKVVAAIADLPPPPKGEQGAPGRLPIVRNWTDAVHYEGDAVSHAGAVYQAQRDTGREPPHDDWRCIVTAGRDGRSLAVRGTWKDAEQYNALDLVALNGASFIARRDQPGPCPGDGWQIVAMQGKQGKPGLTGVKGERGQVATASVIAAAISGEGLLTLTNADGSKIECDLYPLLSKVA